MPSHHSIFSKFTPFKGTAAAGCDRDFIGSSVRRAFWAGEPRDSEIHVEAPLPAFDEEYFEWIDVLESVAEARGRYTMMELGAGFGRWAVRAALANRQFNAGVAHHLIAAEPEPIHFEWLQTHFRDNGIDPDAHTLIRAAVSASSGNAALCVGSPMGNDAPDVWYGQLLVKFKEAPQGVAKDTHAGFRVHRYKSGWKSISVPVVSVGDLLRKVDRVDLIDLDVQGEELVAIEPAMEELDRKARRLHIGTHEAGIECGLRKVLGAHGWRCVADYGCGGARETPYGTIDFNDGVQSWINPRLD